MYMTTRETVTSTWIIENKRQHLSKQQNHFRKQCNMYTDSSYVVWQVCTGNVLSKKVWGKLIPFLTLHKEMCYIVCSVLLRFFFVFGYQNNQH